MQRGKTALLVIDVQVGPITDTYKTEETLNVIRSLISKAKKEEIPVIYVQHEGLPGGPMMKGSELWNFALGIFPRPNDLIIHKQATDAFYQTSLEKDLETKGIKHLIVVGFRTEYCVDTTCRHAINLGFEVTLVEDGHSCVDGVIPAESIIKHHNYNLSTVGTREGLISVIPAENVVLTK
jgi:nicotinamidase-related amidase